MRTGGFGKALAFICLALLNGHAAGAVTPTPPGTEIRNTAVLTWKAPAGSSGAAQALNYSLTTTLTTTVAGPHVPASATFLTYAPGFPGQVAGPTQCVGASGLHTSSAIALPAPVSAQGVTLDPNSPLSLGPTQLFYPGDPVFVQITDPSQNLDPQVRESVLVEVSVVGTTQSASLRLSETGPDTGVFIGYVLTTASGGQTSDCQLALAANQRLALHYGNAANPGNGASTEALVSPYNLVFDSATGQPVNGAKITLLDAQSATPATVIGRDGVSTFPSTVTSGQAVADASGANYSAATGTYLLPVVGPGQYRLQVEAPPGYRFASTAAVDALQKLPGAPFTLGPASFGQAFTLDKTQPVGFDIPLEPVSTHLFVQKSVSAVTAAVGDMLQFSLTVENSDKDLAAQNVTLVDTLPAGFRYMPGSARLAGVKTAEPTISADGLHLEFPVGALKAASRAQVTYVTEVTAATPLGTAINRVQAFATGGGVSNVGTAQVDIHSELMQDTNTLIGRVLIGCDKDAKTPPEGVGGVRMLMETGTYAVTDADGRFHFQDVRNGTHVVQLDSTSLPKGYEAVSCKDTTRSAGRAYSQFVELHGGALWRTDFHVRARPAARGEATVTLQQHWAAGRIHSRIDIDAGPIPLSHTSLTLVLPEGATYVPGSSSLDDARIADPEVTSGMLVFRTGDRAGGWHGHLQFDLATDAGARDKTLATRMLFNFDTPAAAHQHTPVASVQVSAKAPGQTVSQHQATQGRSPVDAQAARGDIPGDTDDDAASADTGFHLDAQWLDKADATAQVIWPKPDYVPPMPTIRVAVKHDPKLRASLRVNGERVSPRNMEGVTSNGRHTAAVTTWLGIGLREGDNSLSVELSDHGKPVKELEQHVHYSGLPVRAEMVPEKSTLVADGKTRPRLAVRLYDSWGKPVRRGVTGHFALQAPYQAYQSIADLQNHQLLATAPRQPTYTVGDDGIAMLVLAPTTTSGQVSASIPLQNDTHADLHAWLQPGQRDWILVGVANGTLAFNSLKGHMQTTSGNDPNKDIVEDGRVAFYAKGTIQGKYLLTLAYDTARRNNISANGLQQQIDPNQLFMLYGDASEQGYDADSAGKLYLKIERGRFNAMFGNFDTGLTVTELSRYQRRFNGIKSQFDGKHFGYTAFAARNAQSFVRDQIQGNGTSGLYHLARQQILLNSEHISIETRDRFHSETVINTRSLSRFLDYSIDYTTGAIFFKQPVPSVDENFNPVYIVAEYEVQRPGDQAITAGGRAVLKLADDRVQIGVTAVNEGSATGDNRLFGADLRAELGAATELKAEIAHTHTGSSGVSSQLGGYNPYVSSAGASSGNGSGLAWLISLLHHGRMLDGELYARQLGIGFGLGQQSLGEQGMRKYGGKARYRINEHWNLQAEAYRQVGLQQHTSRTAADVAVAWQGKGNSVSLGLRHIADNYVLAGAQPVAVDSMNGDASLTSGQLNTGNAAGNGATNQAYLSASTHLLNDKLTVHGSTSQSIGGGNDTAYPDQTQIGADYLLNPAVTLFLNQQFADSQRQGYSHMTELGVRATPWNNAKLTSSLGQQMTEYGPRTFATSGLTQNWQVSKTLTLSAGMEQVRSLRSPNLPAGASIGAGGTGTLSGSSGIDSSAGTLNAATPPIGGSVTQDYTSMFLGATWRHADWSWTSRVESLRSSSEHRLGILGGFYRDLSHGNALSASLNAFDSSMKSGGKSSNADLRLSFAHRPDDATWSFLEQLDLIYGNQQNLAGSLFLQQGSTGVVASQQSPGDLADAQGTSSTYGINQQTWKVVNNLQANYTGENAQWSIYYGFKYARYVFDSGNYTGFTDLIGSEFRYDLGPNWDLGVNGSRLHSWRSGVSRNSLGLELGHNLGHNTWVSVGYNFLGFRDQDFSAAHYTAKGVFLRLRMKFDQDSLHDFARRGQP